MCWYYMMCVCYMFWIRHGCLFFVLGAGIQACLCNLLSTMWMAVARHLSKQCLDSRVHQPLSVVTQEAFGLFGRSSSSAAAVVQTRARCKSMGWGKGPPDRWRRNHHHHHHQEEGLARPGRFWRWRWWTCMDLSLRLHETRLRFWTKWRRGLRSKGGCGGQRKPTRA